MELLTLIQFAAGLVVLILGGELLVRGATRLAGSIGISALVIGLTVVAFGTSAPELAVSLQAATMGHGDLALGNVVGSNILNVLLILGLSAAIAPLAVARQLVRIDVPIMIAAGLVVWGMASDGSIGRLEGGLLFGGILGYIVFSIWYSRKQEKRADPPPQAALPAMAPEAAPKAPESAPAAGPAVAPVEGRNPPAWLISLALVGGGLASLTIGSSWLVEAARAFAAALGVSDVIIGLTVVAVGTSLPEIVTSVVAGARGQRDIAVGNVIGSNLFNMLAVLGSAALVAPSGIAVPPTVLSFDLPVMAAVLAACLPVFFNGMQISRWEGLIFLAYYAAYTAYLILAATSHAALSVFSAVMLAFVLPLTLLTLVVVTAQNVRLARRRVAASPVGATVAGD
jgi:cation:H+ antiporter